MGSLEGVVCNPSTCASASFSQHVTGKYVMVLFDGCARVSRSEANITLGNVAANPISHHPNATKEEIARRLRVELSECVAEELGCTGCSSFKMSDQTIAVVVQSVST